LLALVIVTLLFAGVAGSAAFAGPPAQSSLGDLNCDGRVDSRDAAIVLQFEAFGIPPMPSCAGSADVNGDGTISSIDALLILQYTAGLIPAFLVL
jgi:hypothetical protein